jgi:hypothetical protein
MEGVVTDELPDIFADGESSYLVLCKCGSTRMEQKTANSPMSCGVCGKDIVALDLRSQLPVRMTPCDDIVWISDDGKFWKHQ